MATTQSRDLECSPFQRRPAYRYIRGTDRLPTPETVGPDPLARVKLFNPTGTGTWYLAAYDPETRVAYGAAHLFDYEMGDISMNELTTFRGRFGLPIERDLHWTPRPLSECQAFHNA
jgi:Protein of unknown function (DUF2958)